MPKFWDLEAYLRVKYYVEDNDVTIEDLMRSFNDKIVPVTVTCNGSSKKFYSLASAANYMGVSLLTMAYACYKKRSM